MITFKKGKFYLDKGEFYLYWSRLVVKINKEDFRAPYLGFRTASVIFTEPYVLCGESYVISLAVMRLLLKCAYHTGASYGKFTFGYDMKIPKDDSLTGRENILYRDTVSFILGPAIPLSDSDGNLRPSLEVLYRIYVEVQKAAEKYNKEVLDGIFIKIYLKEDQLPSDIILPLSSEELSRAILDLNNRGSDVERNALPLKKSNKNYHNYITALKPQKAELRPFIVADLETILVNDEHVPCAAGFQVVYPGENVACKPNHSIETYYSEDYIGSINKFEDRSDRMLFSFMERLKNVVRKKGNQRIRTIYFHNLRRFDGILLIKYFVNKGIMFRINPIFRNHLLYKLSVYEGKKLLFTFKDSLNLLPGSLDSLAKTLCPELGPKHSIQHDNLNLDVLNNKEIRRLLLNYMEQDIRLLGGVMIKAQQIFYHHYNIDIESILTISSLALTIFRRNYYDADRWPIHIPSQNEDSFIRRAYYGGHTDAYIPYGGDLYYYDVNSLYPYIMKTFPMPGGKPVWRNNLEDEDLSDLFGFIESYVVCPTDMDRPFLPYRDKITNTLIFLTGEFVGVYYSEELKYARDLGYKIVPIRGYLFEKKPSPFENFITSLYGERLKAKKNGDEAMVYAYKMLMNSLYGRFGINPESTITVICDKTKYESLLMKNHFKDGIKLNDKYYLVSYISKKTNELDTEWGPPRLSAVQLAAAITACSRIHMYPFISKKDCLYTDTDSVVLGSPLEDEFISPTELGKFKLENKIKKGFFLAPKAYKLYIEDNYSIIKYKGAAKSSLDGEWFEEQYKDPSQEKYILVKSFFKINWETIGITKDESLYKLTTPDGSKRDRLYKVENGKKIWIGSKPKIVIDYDSQDITVYKNKIKELEDKNKIKELEDKNKIKELEDKNK